MTSALAELQASAATPDERAFATISGRTQVRVTLAAGYYGWASAADLERQLTRLARLLFVARMKAYYVARSERLRADLHPGVATDQSPRRGLRARPVPACTSRARRPVEPIRVSRGRHGLLGRAPGP